MKKGLVQLALNPYFKVPNPSLILVLYLIHQQNWVLVYGCRELQQSDNFALDFDDIFLDVPHVSLILLNAHDIDLLKKQ